MDARSSVVVTFTVLLGCSTPPEPSPSFTCGHGTSLVDSECVAAEPECGSGSHAADNKTCVRDARYELRAPARAVADGYTPIELRVFGTTGDGTNPRDKLLLRADRASAGAFASPAVVLDGLGAASNFLACNAATSGCLGPVRVAAVRESEPGTVVASVDVELVAPEPIGSAEPCLIGGNQIYVDATNYYYDDVVTASTGTWDVFGAANRVTIQMVPAPNENNWRFTFNTTKMDMPLLPTVYRDVHLAVTAEVGHAGMDFSVPSPTHPGCQTYGDFEVHAFEHTGENIQRITASFSLVCDSDPTRRFDGCVHYQQ